MPNIAGAVVSISRDPFARQEIVRTASPDYGGKGCRGCGNTRPSGRLFAYGTRPDSMSGQIHWHTGLFCSKSCHDIFHR